MNKLNFLVMKTEFKAVEPSYLLAALNRVSEDGKITKDAFDEAIAGIVPAASLNDIELEFLSRSLSNIFFAFDRSHGDSVSADELATGEFLSVHQCLVSTTS